jgi:hypothetical protein
MEGVELEQEDEEFVEEPMTADFDYANANDPIALDEPISQGISPVIEIQKTHDKYQKQNFTILDI